MSECKHGEPLYGYCPECDVKPVSEEVKSGLALRVAEEFNRQNKAVIELKKEINEIMDEVDRLINDEPDADGNYFHLVFCNGDRKTPIGTPGKLCNCKSAPLFNRLMKRD